MMNEKISALIDNEGNPDERQELFDQILADDRAHSCWQRYHLIGCVLRGEVEQAGTDLSDRIRSRLNSEPTVLAPMEQPKSAGAPARTDIWKSASLLAIAASVALMAVITLKPAEEGRNANQIASSGTTLESPHSAQFEDEFGEMLVQHGEFTSSPGLNGLVVYAKLVSNEPLHR